MSNGIKHLYFNTTGDDRRDEFQSMSIKETHNSATATLSTQVQANTTYSWTPYNSKVILIDDNDNVRFLGYVNYHEEKAGMDKGLKEVVLQVDDIREYSKNQSVRMRFLENTSITQAIISLFTAYYPSDTVDSSNFPTELNQAECDLTFDGSQSFADAIDMCLSLLEDDYYWTYSYNVGTDTITHHIYKSWQTNIATYQNLDVRSKPFTDDMKSVFNVIHMSANQVTMDYPYRQRYYFPETGQDDYSLSLSGTLDTVFVPLAKAPAGEIKCYLLIGKDTNPETLANASRFEIPVKPADENKLNYDWDIRRNLQAIDPDYIPDFLQVKDDSITGIIASGATGQKLGEAVKQKIIGLYSPKFEGYFFDEQVPDLESSVYGYLSLRSKIYMVNNIGALNYAINQMIDKDDILGYEIVYPYNVQYSRLFEDDTSITSYGRRFKKEGVKNFSNIKSFNLYGKALLAKYTQVVKKGEAMIRYHDGSAFDQTYPLVGKLCDVSCGSFTDWNATDVRIQNVDHTITPTRWTCKITAQRQTTFGKLEALLKALEAKGGEMKSDITTELLIEDTLTLTDNTATATAFTVADMTWSGQSFKEIILQ